MNRPAIVPGESAATMSLTAIISDIHSNIHALEAVLDDARNHGAERIVCLGDVVGYGAHPVECVDMARTFSVCLRGNHEAGMMGALGGFNSDARRAAEWSRDLMKPPLLAGGGKRDRWKFLRDLPERREEDDVLLVHGSPRDPVWEYLFETDCAGPLDDAPAKIGECLALVSALCFVGHTHVPGIIDQESRFHTPDAFDGRFELEEGAKAIINVGSVGQPRDLDSRSSYVLLEGSAVTFRRVVYDVNAAVQDIVSESGLPDANGERLLRGM